MEHLTFSTTYSLWYCTFLGCFIYYVYDLNWFILFNWMFFQKKNCS